MGGILFPRAQRFFWASQVSSGALGVEFSILFSVGFWIPRGSVDSLFGSFSGSVGSEFFVNHASNSFICSFIKASLAILEVDEEEDDELAVFKNVDSLR